MGIKEQPHPTPPLNQGEGISANIVGRFAPSPTGQLHFGSLTTAVASYCHIKSLSPSSKWLVRIEDTDRQRCKAEFSQSILADLSNLGLHWDGKVIYQSKRIAMYEELLYHVFQDKVYACQCSRKDLQGATIYPQFCLDKNLDWHNHKLRIELLNKTIEFNDGILGVQKQNPQQTLGDMVIRRADGIFNYIFAVSVDDVLQKVTHVMRGVDILPMTSAQIAITEMLDMPKIENWYHLPLVRNEQGQKLSKQNLAKPIDTSTEQKCSELLAQALKFLQQPKVTLDSPRNMLAQAVRQWDNELIKV